MPPSLFVVHEGLQTCFCLILGDLSGSVPILYKKQSRSSDIPSDLGLRNLLLRWDRNDPGLDLNLRHSELPVAGQFLQTFLKREVKTKDRQHFPRTGCPDQTGQVQCLSFSFVF